MLRRIAVLSLILAACSSKEAAPEAPSEPPKIIQGADPADAPAPEPEPELVGEAYVTVTTSMRKTPNNDMKVPDPERPGKKMSNWVALLDVGEQVTIQARENEEWSKARASDDTEGFLKNRFLIAADEASLATVLEEVKIFNRPDLLALNASRTLEPGTLVFKVSEKDQFSELRIGSRTEWVLTEKLVLDGQEVEAAKLLAKARRLREKGDDGYEPLLELLKGQFAETKLVAYVEEQEALAEDSVAEAKADADADADPTDEAAEEEPAEEAEDE